VVAHCAVMTVGRLEAGAPSRYEKWVRPF